MVPSLYIMFPSLSIIVCSPFTSEFVLGYIVLFVRDALLDTEQLTSAVTGCLMVSSEHKLHDPPYPVLCCCLSVIKPCAAV